MKIGIQCSSYTTARCGIRTYSVRLNEALKKKGIDSHIFIEKPHKDVDAILIQYEPGILPPQKLNYFVRKFIEPLVIVTAHHSRDIDQFYPILDGVVFHDESQIIGEPWEGLYTIIPHPALVFPRLDKKKVRKELKLPVDKTIIGTAGFITGTGKKLPVILESLLPKIDDSMFIYFITSFWKAGDLGRLRQIQEIVKRSGKANQFRIDTDFLSEKELNKRMQACDLLFSWNDTSINDKGSQSGIAADMYGSYTKLIVKDSPHYNFIKKQDKVLVGRLDVDDFTEDVINAVKKEDLTDVPDPSWLSWDKMVDRYIEFIEELS